MIEIRGDFWKAAPDYEVLVCTTNQIVTKAGLLVMGGGIALDFADTFPNLPLDWGKQTKAGLNLTMSYDDKIDKWLIGFPTKKDYRDDSSIELIEQSAILLKKCIDDRVNYTDKVVLMTRPGCGLGNLNWRLVKPVIEKYLDDRFYVIER